MIYLKLFILDCTNKLWKAKEMLKSFFTKFSSLFSKNNNKFDVSSQKPSCLADFNTKLIQKETNPLTTMYEIRCKACEGDKFQISCYLYDEFETPPHEAICAHCHETMLLFDLKKHGYNAVIGNGTFYYLGTGNPVPIKCNLQSYGVRVEFIYNIDTDELIELAEESNSNPVDLFDFISIQAVDDKNNITHELSYECA